MITDRAIHRSLNPNHYGQYSLIEDDGEQFILWQVYLTQRESLDDCAPDPEIDRTTAYDNLYFDPRISYRSTCPMYLDWTGCFEHIPIVRFNRPELPKNFVDSYPIDSVCITVTEAAASFYGARISHRSRKIRRFDYGRVARLRMRVMRKRFTRRIRAPWEM